MTRRMWASLLVLAGAVGAADDLVGQCELDWAAGLASPYVQGRVYALTVFDDGSGPALYVGGSLAGAGGIVASGIIKWNGTTWSPLGSGVGEYEDVYALTVFDDGSGPALYAGGDFSTAGGVPANGIAKWDGKTWRALGSGVAGLRATVRALVVFDDGSGPALYAGGSFERAGGVDAWNIARWDGTTWSPVGEGTNGTVYALAVFDDGRGPALFAAGAFTEAGGVGANYVARWDGTKWSALGEGVGGGDWPQAYALTVYDPPGPQAGPGLYVGGNFLRAGEVVANHIARWDGATWSALGAGMGGGATEPPEVRSLIVFDDGHGQALYAGGRFRSAGGVGASCIARWDGAAWSALGAGTSSTVFALAGFDDGAGPALYVGGQFTKAGEHVAHAMAKWKGSQWVLLGRGVSTTVEALTIFDDGSGPGLYAAGWLRGAGGVSADHIARWDGLTWAPLGAGTDTAIHALAVFDDGSGPALYAGGEFRRAGGGPASRVAGWDGKRWSALGAGLTGLSPMVLALAAFDDGRGPALFVGGQFSHAGDVAATCIARWDGHTWSALGSGTDDAVWALEVFDDGRGPALYVGGQFAHAGGVRVNRIAKWDGHTWWPLGSGMDGFGHVNALTVFDDGTGPALYAGGWMSTAGGVPVNRVAKWDGVKWSDVGYGVYGGDNYCVLALTVFDDGSGPALYAAGRFTETANGPAKHIAKWDGKRWSALGDGLSGGTYLPGTLVHALGVYDDWTGPHLYAGGMFTGAGRVSSGYIAKWGCVLGTLIGDLNCDGRVNRLDIDPFVLALSDPDAYAKAYPKCNRLLADVNQDGVPDNFDIDPFVALLTGK